MQESEKTKQFKYKNSLYTNQVNHIWCLILYYCEMQLQDHYHREFLYAVHIHTQFQFLCWALHNRPLESDVGHHTEPEQDSRQTLIIIQCNVVLCNVAGSV